MSIIVKETYVCHDHVSDLTSSVCNIVTITAQTVQFKQLNDVIMITIGDRIPTLHFGHIEAITSTDIPMFLGSTKYSDQTAITHIDLRDSQQVTLVVRGIVPYINVKCQDTTRTYILASGVKDTFVLSESAEPLRQWNVLVYNGVSQSLSLTYLDRNQETKEVNRFIPLLLQHLDKDVEYTISTTPEYPDKLLGLTGVFYLI